MTNTHTVRLNNIEIELIVPDNMSDAVRENAIYQRLYRHARRRWGDGILRRSGHNNYTYLRRIPAPNDSGPVHTVSEN